MVPTFVCFASFVIAIAQADSTKIVSISQLVRTTWTWKDGAPLDIRDVAQTLDGSLWIGGDSGLTRFDGARFVQFKPQHGDTLPSTGVRHLRSARDGALWIVWRNGAVSRLREDRLITFGERDGLHTAFRVAESSAGLVVAGTAAGLAEFADGKWRDVSREWGYPDTEGVAVWFDRVGALWVESEARVLYRPAGGTQFADPMMPLTFQPGVRADFAEAPDGTIWMAEVGRSAHTVPRIGDKNPVTEVMVSATTLLVDREGTLWVGSNAHGIRRLTDLPGIRGKKIQPFDSEAEQLTERNGLLSNYVVSLLEDRDGGIWVATTLGLQRFRHAFWYQTIWFRYALAGFIGACGVFAAMLVQRRRHLLAEQALKARYAVTLAERGRIAQELHDTLLQGFIGITFSLRAIQQRLADPSPDGAAALDHVAGLAETTLRDARRMIWDMRAPELDQHDLPRAIELSAERLRVDSKVRLQFETTGSVRALSPKSETALFRIAREGVSNALRHAGASTIIVSLGYEPAAIRLSIRDDGRGFVPEQAAAAAEDGHMGLRGVHARAQEIGAIVQISSERQLGTTVTVVVRE